MNLFEVIPWAVVLAIGLASVVRPIAGVTLLVGGFFIADRGFAYIHINIGNIPLFVSEACLLGCLSHYAVAWARKGFERPQLQLNYWTFGWALFAFAALQSTFRGVLMGIPFSAVLRDSAIAYYALFFPIVACARVSDKTLSYCTRFLVSCLIFKTLYLVGAQLTEIPWLTPEDPNPAAQSMHFALCLLMSFALWPHIRWKMAWFGILTLQILVITLQLVRTTWLSLVIAHVVLLLFLWRSSGWKKFLWKPSLSVVGAGIVLSLLLSGMNVVRGRNLSMLQREMHSFTEGRKSDNIQTRLWLWQDALIDTFKQGENIDDSDADSSKGQKSKLAAVVKPLFGTPFGKKFLPPDLVRIMTVSRFDPHNSFIAILYRMGILGLAGFLLAVGFSLYRALKVVWREKPFSANHYAIIGCFCGVIYILSHANWDVTLENPFKGAFLWMLLGLLEVFRSRPESNPAFVSTPQKVREDIPVDAAV